MRVDEAAPFIMINSDWGVSNVLDACKEDLCCELGMVIDLSYKDRGHEQTKFEAAGVTHVKIPIPGKRIPYDGQVQEFFDAVDKFYEEQDDDKLLGVQSTSGKRAGFLICCYLMDRKEVEIEDAISVFNKLVGPEADPTKDKDKELYRTGLRVRNMNRKIPCRDGPNCKFLKQPGGCRFLHDGVAANGGPEEQMYEPTIPCRNGNKCKFVNLPDGCRFKHDD